MSTLSTIAKPKKFLKPLVHLPVKDLRQTLDYYRDQLGFANEWTFGEIDGGIRKDDLQLLFEQNTHFVNDINNEKHRLPVIWFVDDVDAIYDEFKKRGIEIADDLKIQPYGLKEFAFIDINGYYIRIAEGTDEG